MQYRIHPNDEEFRKEMSVMLWGREDLKTNVEAGSSEDDIPSDFLRYLLAESWPMVNGRAVER